MRDAGAWVIAVGLIGGLGMPGRADAQAVGFAPGIGQVPDGVGLSATPAVSSDRRYVRLSIGAGFQTVDGFSNFPVPAAVAGGGGGNGGGMIPGGLGVLSGMDGPIAPTGMAGTMGPGYPDGSFEDLGAWRPAPRRARVAKVKPARARKPDPDPVVVPSKKKP